MTKCLLAVLLTVVMPSTAPAQADDAVQILELAKTSASWDGEELPRYGPGQPEITILKATVPPGARFSLHRHPVINAGVMLSGRLLVVTEDSDTLHVEAGEALVEVVDEWHFGVNDGAEPAEILVFYAGIKDRRISINE